MSTAFNLTSDQSKFACVVLELKLDFLFDWENRSFNHEEVKNYFQSASKGEVIMLKFLLGVWLNENKFGFDLFEATEVLDLKLRQIIMDWMTKPIWP